MEFYDSAIQEIDGAPDAGYIYGKYIVIDGAGGVFRANEAGKEPVAHKCFCGFV